MRHSFVHFYPEDTGSGGSDPNPEGGDGGSGSGTPDPVNQPPAGTPDPQAGDGDRGDSETITKLRSEAAGYRTKLREAEARVKELEDAEKTDLEKAQSQVQDLNEQLTTMELRVRRSVVSAIAGDVGIVREARSDVAELLDWSKIEDPTDEKAVEKELRSLIKEKPYLTGGVAGGADGGAGGGKGSQTATMNDLIRAGRR